MDADLSGYLGKRNRQISIPRVSTTSAVQGRRILPLYRRVPQVIVFGNCLYPTAMPERRLSHGLGQHGVYLGILKSFVAVSPAIATRCSFVRDSVAINCSIGKYSPISNG